MSNSTSFADTLQRAIKRGLVGAAVIDRDGDVVDRAGVAADDQRSSLADLLAHLKSQHALSVQLFAGELVGEQQGPDAGGVLGDEQLRDGAAAVAADEIDRTKP